MERTDKMSELDQTLTLPHFKQNIQMFLIPQIFLPLNSADQLNHCRYGGASGRDGSHLRHQLLRQRDGPEDAAEEPRWGAGTPPAGHGRRLLRGDDDHRDGARGADQVPPPGGLHSDRQLSVCAQFEGWGQVWVWARYLCQFSPAHSNSNDLSIFSTQTNTRHHTPFSAEERDQRICLSIAPHYISRVMWGMLWAEACFSVCSENTEQSLVCLVTVRTSSLILW